VNYSDIPVISQARWGHSADWYEILDMWAYSHRGIPVELQPDFQRGYVWTGRQQICYIENMLKGHYAGREIYFNHPTWGTFEDAEKHPIQCIDGQQRIGAVVEFMENRLPIFGGHYYKDIEGPFPWVNKACFNLHINNLKSRKEILQWYLDLNTGGTVHTDEEIERVRRLLAEAV
jgi:hypothetical protein